MTKTPLKHLGVQSQDPIVELDTIDWHRPGQTTVKLDCSEFTSHCPVTKQPDFGRIEIAYLPGTKLVETKSLKLWLWQWRDRAAFNEEIVHEIAAKFMDQVEPLAVTVTGHFNPRGGISVTPEVTLVRGAEQ